MSDVVEDADLVVPMLSSSAVSSKSKSSLVGSASPLASGALVDVMENSQLQEADLSLDPADLKIEEVEFMEEDSEKLILVITGDQEDGTGTAADLADAGGSLVHDPLGPADLKLAQQPPPPPPPSGLPGSKEVPEPFADVLAGESLYLCPADCSKYSREAEDMSQHIRYMRTIMCPNSPSV